MFPIRLTLFRWQKRITSFDPGWRLSGRNFDSCAEAALYDLHAKGHDAFHKFACIIPCLSISDFSRLTEVLNGSFLRQIVAGRFFCKKNSVNQRLRNLFCCAFDAMKKPVIASPQDHTAGNFILQSKCKSAEVDCGGPPLSAALANKAATQLPVR